MQAIEVREPSQIAQARRAAATLARAHGFDEEDAGRVSIVASELATNLVKHGGGGELLVGSYDDRSGCGIELLALDKGVGMADVPASSRDGHSTAGSPGTGLGAIRRGSHYSDIYSLAGAGTAVLARLEAGRPPDGAGAMLTDFGVVNVAIRGEQVSGDGWCGHASADGLVLMVSDGLGHGPFAAEASHAAIHTFNAMADAGPTAVLTQMHSALRPTRGAAIGVARLDYAQGAIIFAGIGNIAATIVDADGRVQRMMSNNGIVGHVAKQIRDFTYRLGDRPLVVLASDGLGTGWRLDDYPGLAQRHPSLVAGVLYRDHNRGRDDVTVLVARGSAQ